MKILLNCKELSLNLIFNGEFLTNMIVTNFNMQLNRTSIGRNEFEITANSLFMLNDANKNQR